MTAVRSRRRAVQVLRRDLAAAIGEADALSFVGPFSAVAFAVLEDEEPLEVLAVMLTNHLKRPVAAADLSSLAEV